MGRWLGIDHGTKRVGVAAGTTEERIASPLTTLKASPIQRCLKQITEIAERYAVDGIVVGLPLNMDGSAGAQAELARRMARQLSQITRRDVRLWDERLSSFAADSDLAGAFTRNKRRARQDAVAAAKMLEDFLASNGPDTAERADQATDAEQD